MGVVAGVLLALDVVVFLGAIVAQIVLIQQAQRAPDAPTRAMYETRGKALTTWSTVVVVVLTAAVVVDVLAIGA